MKKSALAAIAVTLSFSGLSAWAATVENIMFENHALVITSDRAGGKPVLKNWESQDGKTQTRMIVLDLPEVSADRAQLDAMASAVLKKNPDIRRLILTPTYTPGGENALRVVMEVIQKAGQTLEPAVTQSGGKTMLALIPVTEMPDAVETQQAAQILDAEQQKKIAALQTELAQAREQLAALRQQTKSLQDNLVAAQQNLADAQKAKSESGKNDGKLEDLKEKLERAESLQKELVMSNQELVKKNHKLETELGNANQHLTAALEENVRLQQDKKPAAKKQAEQDTDTAQHVKAEEYFALLARYQELEKQLAETQNLKQQNDALLKQVMDLQAKLVTQDTLIREVTPGTPDNVANLKTALVQVALKLKETQNELARLKGQQETHVPIHHSPVNHAPPQTATPSGKAELESMIRNEPANYDAYMQLQKLYITEGDYGKAEAVLQNLLVVNPRMADAYYALAELYLIQNNPINARASLETYRRLKPYDTRRIHALEQQLSTN